MELRDLVLFTGPFIRDRTCYRFGDIKVPAPLAGILFFSVICIDARCLELREDHGRYLELDNILTIAMEQILTIFILI